MTGHFILAFFPNEKQNTFESKRDASKSCPHALFSLDNLVACTASAQEERTKYYETDKLISCPLRWDRLHSRETEQTS